jgi:hypothetical protein
MHKQYMFYLLQCLTSYNIHGTTTISMYPSAALMGLPSRVHWSGCEALSRQDTLKFLPCTTTLSPPYCTTTPGSAGAAPQCITTKVPALQHHAVTITPGSAGAAPQCIATKVPALQHHTTTVHYKLQRQYPKNSHINGNKGFISRINFA